MLKLPPPPPKTQDADKATSSGNPAGLEQSKNAAGEDGDDDQGKLPDIGGGDGSVDKDAFTPTCDSTLPPTVASDGPANEAATTAKGNSTGQPAEIPKDALVANGDNTGHPTYASKNNQETAAADDGQEKEKADAGEMYRKAAAALEEAMELNALAEAYSEAPDRLSNYFIATTFPFDNRDNSYAFCIICGLPGDLLVCDKHDCPNVMHYECGGLSEVPEADWFCGECVPIPTAGNDAKIETPSAAEEEKATTDDLQASQVSKNVANNSSPNESKVDKADAMDTDPGGTDVQGAPTKENEEKPPAVTSCLPPIVTFDEKRATDLESSLDDLYFARTGRRRGEGKQKKSGRLLMEWWRCCNRFLFYVLTIRLLFPLNLQALELYFKRGLHMKVTSLAKS